MFSLQYTEHGGAWCWINGSRRTWTKRQKKEQPKKSHSSEEGFKPPTLLRFAVVCATIVPLELELTLVVVEDRKCHYV
jgi:hypothetical protein